MHNSVLSINAIENFRTEFCQKSGYHGVVLILSARWPERGGCSSVFVNERGTHPSGGFTAPGPQYIKGKSKTKQKTHTQNMQTRFLQVNDRIVNSTGFLNKVRFIQLEKEIKTNRKCRNVAHTKKNTPKLNDIKGARKKQHNLREKDGNGQKGGKKKKF